MDKFTQVRQQIRNYRTRHLRIPRAFRGSRAPYYRRGVLVIPSLTLSTRGQYDSAARKTTDKIIREALQLPADCICFDLHELVPAFDDFKILARKQVISTFRTTNFGNRVRTLHCNPVRSPWFEDDIVEVVGETGEQLDSVFISGCETGEEVRDVQTILRNVQHAAGRRNRIFLEVVIDSPRAFTDMEAIAALEDVTSLVFSANFARALGASPPNGHSRLDLVTAREMLPIVAAAHGKLAVDGVTRPVPQEPTARDEALALIAEDSRISAEQGYSAAWISSHAAIDVIQSAWTPTRERALLALKTAVSYGESKVRPAQHALPDRRAVIADWPSVRHAHTAGILSDEDFAEHGCTLNELEHAIQS